MARSGLYKSDVKNARNGLLAQGRHPSVDAVRIALGNTGSKTTIHKYLKELEAEEGGADHRRIAVSDALQHLVEQLAAQLHQEAERQIEVLRTEFQTREQHSQQELNDVRVEATQLRNDIVRLESALQQERAAHAANQEQLRQETLRRHTAEQNIDHLRERLAEHEAHRQSLEQKHQHARDALEHYRQSAKEQRDQDARRHEHQVQQLQAEIRTLQQSLVVKQDDVTRLNQEGMRLVTELSHAQSALRDHATHRHQLEQQLTALPALQARTTMLEDQLMIREQEIQQSASQLSDARARLIELNEHVHRLQIDLATSQAKLEGQQTASAELRAFLDQIQTRPSVSDGRTG